MKQAITCILSILFAIVVFGQNFEGKIVYKNAYKSKIPNLTDEQFTTMMGSVQEYFVKGGDYKSVVNGSLFQYQVYLSKDNKLYNKMGNSEVVLWNDGASNPDQVLNTAVNKGVTEILGYTCDELVLTCKSGIQKYYFNAKIAVDKSLYQNHKFGNWYEMLSITNALPLKSVIDNAQFTVESVAAEIQAMKLDKALFELPAGVKTMKSPY